MDTLFLVLGVIALLTAIVAIASAVDRRAEAKRAREMAFFAGENGFQVLPELTTFRRAIGDFSLFSRGRSPRLRNVMRQERDDVTVALCDYLYWTGSGRTAQRHEQTVCVLVSPGTRLPRFFLRRQVRLLDFLANIWEERDINFDEDPAFSKAFVLYGNEGELRPWFTGDRRARLTALAVEGFELEARGDTILFHLGSRASFDGLARLLNHALAIREASR